MCTSTTAVVWGLDRKVFRNLIAGVAASKVDDVEKLLATYPLFTELTDSENWWGAQQTFGIGTAGGRARGNVSSAC